MREFQRIDERFRAGHRSVLYFAALFEGLEGDGLIGQVDAIGSECQRLRHSAAGIRQRQAQRAHLSTLVRVGQYNEPTLLFSREVFALSIDSEQFAG